MKNLSTVKIVHKLQIHKSLRLSPHLRSKHSIRPSLADLRLGRRRGSGLLQKLQRARRDPDSAAQQDYAAEQRQSACLVSGAERRGDEVPERRDAKNHLKRDKVDDAKHALLCILGQHCADAWREAAVAPERDDSGESGGGESAVVELHEHWVLEHVPPPQVGLVRHVAVEWVEQFTLRREESLAHPGEVVVDHASVKTGHESAGHGGREDQGAESGSHAAEGTELRGLKGLKNLESFLRVGEETVLAEDCKAVPEHVEVCDESGAQMGGETVLRDARVGAGLKKLILQTRLDHPPPNDTLEADESANASQAPRHGLADLLASDEEDGRKQEGDAHDSSPKSVSPFHPVDLLEVVQVHVRVEHLEFGTQLIPRVLIFPMLLAHGWEGAGDRSPFCDAQAGFRETCETTKDHDAKDAGRGAQ